MSFEERCNAVTRKLLSIREKGFGGIVTNVSFDHYTESDVEWRLFSFVASECERLGMRIWIYDEKGYPSGGAGGLTREVNPDYEAVGVVMIAQKLGPHATLTLPLPRGHMCYLGAQVFASSDGTPERIIDFTPLASADCRYSKEAVVLENPSDRTAVACAFAKKRLYEGTHAVHNCCESRRYIDVTNADAVREFLRNTYEKYKSCVGDRMQTENPGGRYAAIGNIEAIFTDEPSLMGCYINAGLYPPCIHDEYDESLPLYPVINWGRDFENAFHSRCGYSCIPGLIYKFAGTSPEAQRYRLDYHQTLSHMVENSFFAQISDWCARNRVAFSGHILLEDDIRHHSLFEGNFFSLLRHMHYPGIDMLQSIPGVIYSQFAFTPKLVSSIAHMYGRAHVMSEVSAHCQGGKVAIPQFYASLCLQYAFGVDVFTSYYGDAFMDTESYATYNAAFSQIDSVMSGRHVADLLLYYPIETFNMHHIGSDRQFGAYTEPENICYNSLKSLVDALIGNQMDFDFTDCDTLAKCRVRDGMIRSPSGETYSALALPAMEYTREIRALVAELRRNGIRVLSLDDPVFENTSGSERFNAADALVGSLDREKFTANHSVCSDGVVMLCRDTGGGRRFMFVNSHDRGATVSIELHGIENPTLFSPLTGEKTAPGTSDGRLSFDIRAYDTVIVC